MKIAVIGANGKTGKAFIQTALKDGHYVHAGVHNKNSLPTHPCLTIVSCNALKQSDVLKLIKGQDAVVSLIGHSRKTPKNLQTEAMNVLSVAMPKAGVTRLISLTGTGVRLPNDKVSFVDRILNSMVRIADPARVQDGIKHQLVLSQTKLEWTVLRVLKLHSFRPGNFRLTLHGPAKVFVSRVEVSQAILRTLVDRKYIGSAPIISKKVR